MTSTTTKLDKQLKAGRGAKAKSGLTDFQIEQRAATDNLLSFTRVFFKETKGGAEFARSEHHRIICRALERVYRGECKRLMINIPPRFSKCISPTTRVLTSKGYIEAQNLSAGDMLYSFEDGKATLNRCQGTEPARKPSLRLTMRSGREIVCSSDHPMLSTFGYVEAQHLRLGDRIQAIKAELDSDYEIPDAELDFITLMIFEGCCTKKTFSSADAEVLNVMRKSCEALNMELRQYPYSAKCDYHIYAHRTTTCSDLLAKYGIKGCLAYDKRLPKEWFALSIRQKLRFIDLMFATDGYINQKTGCAGIGLANRGLVEDIQTILSTVGIVSNVYFTKNAHANAWVLTIPRKYTAKLLGKISFFHKRPSAEKSLDKTHACTVDTFPYAIIKREKLSYQTRAKGLRCENTKEISAAKFLRLCGEFPQLEKYLTPDFYLDRIDKIENVGVQDLIHVGVDATHNFIANGLVSHNTELVAVNFPAWCYAKEPRCRFIHLSYSNDLVETNCKAIQSIMRSPKYELFWPQSTLQGNRPKAQRFFTKWGGEFYTASTGGQITGFGAGAVDAQDDKAKAKQEQDDTKLQNFDIEKEVKSKASYRGEELPPFMGAIIIDDPIKPADALHDTIRERINEKFENTIRSRANSVNTPIIIIMQRTHEHDLCGYLRELEGEEWEVISLPAVSVDEETGEEHSLWDAKMSVEDLRKLQKADSHVFETQYMQNPQPREGLLYEHGFREYEILPDEEGMQFKNVTDTASSGDNYTCSISYIETKTAMYVTDLVYSEKNTDYTVPKIAEMLGRTGTKRVLFESNNGGDQICKAVKNATILAGNTGIQFMVKHQSENKEQRIRLNSVSAQNLVVFPKGWQRKWPTFASQLTSHRYVAAYNKYDDAPDGVTYMVEHFGKKGSTVLAL